MNTIHTNPQTHPTTPRTLSRPPLPIIPSNPFSYNLSSTNINNTQQPSAVSHTQSATLLMNSLSTSQIPQILSNTIGTNSHIYTIKTFPTFSTLNIYNIAPTSNVYYHTIPSYTLPLTTLSNQPI